jgi:hypothetical protein
VSRRFIPIIQGPSLGNFVIGCGTARDEVIYSEIFVAIAIKNKQPHAFPKSYATSIKVRNGGAEVKTYATKSIARIEINPYWWSWKWSLGKYAHLPGFEIVGLNSAHA